MVHIAIVGCSHGEIDTIYDNIQHFEAERQIKVKLVLCCGDFQSVRNMTDLRCMNCPIKYQAMHDFHRYYSGEKAAPIPTIFIGGNHEASNFLQELPYGGWVAPNIYFCGYANILRFGPLRIAGISGIFKGHDYLKGRYECPPYDQNTIRSTYHYRNVDIFRLKQIKSHVDIVLSHDWPRGIYNFGNVHELLRRKPFFREEVNRNELGSRPLHEVLLQLEPSYWFSAHLHVDFYATVPHQSHNTVQDGEGESPTPKTTKFLALDKVLPRRHYLEIIDIPLPDNEEDVHLSYDPEWLAILKSTDHLNNSRPKPCFMPGPGCGDRFDFAPTQDEIDSVSQFFKSEFQVPVNFVQTAPVFQRGEKPNTAFPIENPQTVEFCGKLGITDPLSLCTRPEGRANQANPSNAPNSSFIEANNRSAPLSTIFQEYSPINVSSSSSSAMNPATDTINANPEEIPLDLDDDDDDDHQNSATPARPKLHLPPPKSSDTPSESQKDDKDEQELKRDKAAELKMLEGFFQRFQDNDKTAETEREQVQDFFVIDRTGVGGLAAGAGAGAGAQMPDTESEPELKRKRNEALLKALEGEDG